MNVNFGRFAPFLGQIVLSGTALFVGLLIARSVAADQYAIYVLIVSLVMYFVGVQEALVSVPAIVHVGKRPFSLRGNYIRLTGGVWLSWMVFFVLLAIGILLLFSIYAEGINRSLILWSCLLSLVWCLYDISRSFLIFYDKKIILVVADLSYAFLALSALSWLAIQDDMSLIAALAVLTMGVALGSYIGGVKLIIPRGFLRIRRATRLVLNRGKHSFISSQIGWIQSQSYLWISSAALSLELLAKVAAARLILAPFFTFLTAWVKISLPAFSRRAELTLIHNSISKSSLGFVAIALVLSLLGFYFADWVEEFLFNNKIKEIGFLILGWGAVACSTAVRTVVATALRSIGLHRDLTKIFLIGALVSVPMCIIGLAVFKEMGAFIGLVSAELVMALVGYKLFRKFLKQERL